MMKRTIEKTAAFLLVGCLLLSLLEALFVEKSSYGKNRGWKAAKDVDILILGNSHADGGLRAEDISNGLCAGGDISAFNYGISSVRMEQMYFFAKEAFKTHVPDLVILETFTFCPLSDEDREITNRRAFDALPLSLNKMNAICYCVPEDRASFIFPIIKYHTRWKELSPVDLRLLYDKNLWGGVTGGNGSTSENVCEDPGDNWFQQTPPEELRKISPVEQECLDKFLAMLAENGVSLLFVSVPFRTQKGLDSIEQIKINNYLRENYVNGDTIQLLDMNRMWQELDFDYSDLANEGHVNAAGADKVTECLAEYLRANYNLAALAA